MDTLEYCLIQVIKALKDYLFFLMIMLMESHLILPRIKIKNYNIEIDGRNFYDQPTDDIIKQYDEVRKVSTGQGDDYTTGCLLDFAYFLKKIQINCSRFK